MKYWQSKSWWMAFALAGVGIAPAWGEGTVPRLTLDEQAPPAAPQPYNATGDWFGERTKLEDKGLSFAGFVLLDVAKNLKGGLNTREWPVQYLLDLNFTLDTQKAFGWSGGQVFLELQSHDGPDVAQRLTGDISNSNNMNAVHYGQIYQLWYQQTMFGDVLRWKVGKIDANADFSLIDHGKDFLGAPYGYSPTIVAFPSYPASAPGALAFVTIDKHLYAGAGAFYASSEDTFLNFFGHSSSIQPAGGGMFFVGETGARWTVANDRAGHFAIGGWIDNGRFPRSDGTEADGTGGFYALIDQSLWRSADGGREIAAFMTYGNADAAVTPVSQCLTGGLTLSKPFDFRPDDLVGVGATWSSLGHALAGTGDEVITEAFYKAQLLRWMSVKLDAQYISNPGAHLVDRAVADALLLTVRFEIDF